MDLVRVKDVKADIVAQQGGKIVLNSRRIPACRQMIRAPDFWVLGTGSSVWDMGSPFITGKYILLGSL